MWRSSEEMTGVKEVLKILPYRTTTEIEVKADREVAFAMSTSLLNRHNRRAQWATVDLKQNLSDSGAASEKRMR